MKWWGGGEPPQGGSEARRRAATWGNSQAGPQELTINSPHDSTILLAAVDQTHKDTTRPTQTADVRINTCKSVLVPAFFRVSKNWKQPK